MLAEQNQALTSRSEATTVPFSGLIDRYGSYVERFLARRIGWDPELPDLLQDVFVQALQCLPELRNPEAIKGWLGTIAIFTARAWIRKRRVRTRWLSIVAPDELPELDAVVCCSETREALQRTVTAVDALPVDERLAFSLRFFDGMKLQQIAERCGVSLATTKRTLARAERRFIESAGRDPLLRERIAKSRRWGLSPERMAVESHRGAQPLHLVEDGLPFADSLP